MTLNNTLPSLSGPIQEGFYGIIIAVLVNYEPVFILFSTFLISLFISPLQFNAFMYLKNPQIVLVVLATSIYIIGTYSFIWSLYYNNAALFIRMMKKHFY